jgi:hypothetical protein
MSDSSDASIKFPPQQACSIAGQSSGVLLQEKTWRQYDPAVEKLYHRPGGNPVMLELTTVKATMTIKQLAEAFAGLGDEDQAQFFVEVAKAFAKFGQAGTGRSTALNLGGDWQAMQIGEILGKESTDAISLIRTILEAADEAMVKDVMTS